MNLLVRQVNGIKFLRKISKKIFCIAVGMEMRGGSCKDVRAVLGMRSEESLNGISAGGKIKGKGFEKLNGSEVLVLSLNKIFKICLLN
jgi:hypothetical protein